MQEFYQQKIKKMQEFYEQEIKNLECLLIEKETQVKELQENIKTVKTKLSFDKMAFEHLEKNQVWIHPTDKQHTFSLLDNDQINITSIPGFRKTTGIISGLEYCKSECIDRGSTYYYGNLRLKENEPPSILLENNEPHTITHVELLDFLKKECLDKSYEQKSKYCLDKDYGKHEPVNPPAFIQLGKLLKENESDEDGWDFSTTDIYEAKLAVEVFIPENI